MTESIVHQVSMDMFANRFFEYTRYSREGRLGCLPYTTSVSVYYKDSNSAPLRSHARILDKTMRASEATNRNWTDVATVIGPYGKKIVS